MVCSRANVSAVASASARRRANSSITAMSVLVKPGRSASRARARTPTGRSSTSSGVDRTLSASSRVSTSISPGARSCHCDSRAFASRSSWLVLVE